MCHESDALGPIKRVYDRAMRRLTIAILLFAGTVAGCGGGDGDGGKYGPWRVHASPGTFGVTALWAFASNDVWVGSNIILHFDGNAFTQVTTPAPTGFVTDFLGFAPDDLYAVADVDLLHWDGAAWSVIDTAGAIDPTELTTIWGTSGGDLWLGDSQNGRVFHWDGTVWSTGITQTVSVADLWAPPAVRSSRAAPSGCRDGRAAGGSTPADPVANEATALWGFGAGDVWAASDFGTLAHWDGAAWKDTVPADNPDFDVGDQVAVGGRAERPLGGGRRRRDLALGRRELEPGAAREVPVLPVPEQGARLVGQRRLGGGAQLRRQRTPASSCTTSRSRARGEEAVDRPPARAASPAWTAPAGIRAARRDARSASARCRRCPSRLPSARASAQWTSASFAEHVLLRLADAHRAFERRDARRGAGPCRCG